VSPAAWYQEFYKVRNAFVHGEVVSTKQLSYPLNGRDWLTHRIIATTVFWAAVSEKTLQLKLASGAIQVSDEEMPFLLGAHNWGLKDAFGGLGWIQTSNGYRQTNHLLRSQRQPFIERLFTMNVRAALVGDQFGDFVCHVSHRLVFSSG